MGRAVARVICAVCAGLAAAAAAPATRATSSAPAVPDEKAIATAQRLMREVFAAEYAAADTSGRRALARKFLRQACFSEEDPAARYVLLCEARDIAARNGDPETSFRAITQLTARYGTDPVPMTLAAMSVACRSTADAEALCSAATICMNIAERSAMRDDYAAAQRLLSLAGLAAGRAQNVSLLAAVEARTRERAALEKAHALYMEAARKLASGSADARAHLAVGQFLCFCKGDWQSGLAHLAQCSDRALAEIAHLDRAAPSDAQARYALAGRWWDLAAASGEPFRRNIEDRAAHWYRLALPGLSGLAMEVARKRLEDVEQRSLRDRNLAPGVLAELYRGPAFEQFVKTRLDRQIDFDWGDGAPDEALPRDMFSIRWRGVLRVTTAGRYQLAVQANAGARLWIDGRCIIDAPNLTRSRSGARTEVDLAADLHSLRVDYWDTTGLARMRLLWRPPGAREDEPIPPAAFYHDALTQPR